MPQSSPFRVAHLGVGIELRYVLEIENTRLTQAMLVLDDDGPEDFPQRLLDTSALTRRHMGEGGSDGDLSSIKVRYRSVGVTHSHEEHTLPCHQSPVIEPWPTKSKSVAKLVAVQPATVGLEERLGRVAWSLPFQALDDVVG